MEIEFDPVKDAANRAKHGLAFADARDLEWDSATYRVDGRRDYRETRMVAYVPNKGRLYVVCFTTRGAAIRVISFRKANRREEKIHAQNTAH